MVSSFFATKLMLILISMLALSTSTGAFQVSRSPVRRVPVGLTTLSMSADIENDRIGPTEQLLLDAKDRRERGLVQKMGKTVKGDSLDGVRALVWSAFGMSNYIFGALGALFFVSMAINLAGYGFYFDTRGSIVVDTLEHIREDKFLAAEAARLMADASEGVKNFL